MRLSVNLLEELKQYDQGDIHDFSFEVEDEIRELAVWNCWLDSGASSSMPEYVYQYMLELAKEEGCL